MPSIEEVYASDNHFLKAKDLQKKKITLNIESAALEQVGDQRKIVLRFVGKDKGLVLNKTNANTIGFVMGDETDDWVGGQIKLFESTTSYQGKMVPCIRVEMPVPEATEDETIPF